MSELELLRIKINTVDEKLIELLSDRFLLVEKVGKYKKSHKISAFQEGRWNEVLERVKKLGEEKNISPDCIAKIWNAIHETALQKEEEILHS